MKLLLVFLLLGQSFAHANSVIDDSISNNPIEGIDPHESRVIDDLIEKNLNRYKRTGSCPLTSTKYLDILDKISNIKLLFENTCFSDYQDQFDAILAGAEKFQNTVNEAVDTTGTTTETPVELPKINGQDIATVAAGLNNLFTKNTCSIDQRNFFEKSSEIIRDVTSFSALVPGNNGLIIQGTGSAASALLLFINNIFSKNFNFKDKKYREIFIKLNCSFYDVRKEVELAGIMDIPTPTHQADFEETQRIIEVLKKKIETNNKNLKQITETIREEAEKYVRDQATEAFEVNEVLSSLLPFINKPFSTEGNRPLETQKLEVIQAFGQKGIILSSLVQRFLALEESTLGPLNSMFLKDLDLFNSGNVNEFSELLTMDAEIFEKTIKARLLFNFNRVGDLALNQMVEARKRFLTDSEVRGKPVNTLKEDLFNLKKDLQKKLSEKMIALKRIEYKLERLLSNRDFTSGDDGTETIVNILDEFNEIIAKIYGSIGYQFMDYSLNTAKTELKNFKKKFNKFSKNYLEAGDTIPPLERIGERTRQFACQDAKPYRRMYKFGSALVEQAYDFIETNAELFHSDKLSIYIRKPEERRRLFLMTKWEKLRRHHQSGNYANRIINGSPTFGDSSILTHNSLGELMLMSHDAKSRAQKLQDLIEAYNCKDISNDIN